MTAISASTVQDLRNRTGAGMMDCKKALAETNGDVEKAIDYLRKKGISSAENDGPMTLPSFASLPWRPPSVTW